MSDADAPAAVVAARTFYSIALEHRTLASVADTLATLEPAARHDFIEALNVLMATAALLESAE